MSLLTRGRETVVIHHAEQYIDPDGNIIYRLSGEQEVVTNCAVQLAAQSGTSARRAEQDEEGYDTEDVYRLRPPQTYTREISFAAQVQWNGLMWSVIGNIRIYNGSNVTKHNDYTLRRV